MSTYTVTPAAVSGTPNVTLVAAASGTDEFANTGREYLLVKCEANINANATLVIQSQATCAYGATAGHNLTFTVANSHTLVIGPLDANRFNQANGKVNVIWSGSNVTWANIKVGVVSV